MKKIKLLTSLVGLTGLSMGLVPMISGCSCGNKQITPELTGDKNVKIKESNIVKGQESTITLTIPQGKEIDTLTITIGNKQLKRGTDFTVDSNNKITIKAEVVTGENVSITVKTKDKITAKPFAETELSVLISAIETFETSTQNETEMKALCGKFTDTEYIPVIDESITDPNRRIEAHLGNFIGKTTTIKINNQAHTIRVIGINHDLLKGGTDKYAAFTFEFANLISDSNGNSLATTWDGDGYAGGVNYDYLNSNVFYNLEHLTPTTASVLERTDVYNKYKSPSATGKGNWYQKGGTTPTTDTAYANKSVFDMLPSELSSVLKQVKKEVTTSSSRSKEGYAKESYYAKLFLPTYREMTKSGESTYQKEEGTAYAYYTGTHDTLAGRIKKQVNTSEVYVSTSEATGAAGSVINYAGHNFKTDATGGGYCWLASPMTNFESKPWSCTNTGGLSILDAYGSACAVAPCFCI